MTTRFMDTNAIELLKIKDKHYCDVVDVLKVIHHECYETDDKDILRILDRMEARICKNAFINPPKSKPVKGIPGRYAVGKEHNGEWMFFVDSKDEKPLFSDRPCMAKLYVNYRDADACADFLDGEWDVLDMESAMTEEERWVRELRMPMPFDADEGNEKAIPVEVVK